MSLDFLAQFYEAGVEYGAYAYEYCKKLYRERNTECLNLQGFCVAWGVLSISIHVSIRLLSSALDVTVGLN